MNFVNSIGGIVVPGEKQISQNQPEFGATTVGGCQHYPSMEELNSVLVKPCEAGGEQRIH